MVENRICPTRPNTEIKRKRLQMADETTPNHAQSIENVAGTFEGELRKLVDRASSIQAQTVRAFGDAHSAFDHAEYINEVLGKATTRLSRFLGPPPNILALPKAERVQIEDAEIIE
jgi:hypothetical protein